MGTSAGTAVAAGAASGCADAADVTDFVEVAGGGSTGGGETGTSVAPEDLKDAGGLLEL